MFSTKRHATVKVVNKTAGNFRIQVLHQYTGESTEDSAWKEIGPDETVEMLRVTYFTGGTTTGVDNWIVNGMEKRELDTNAALPDFLSKEKIEKAKKGESVEGLKVENGKLYINMRWKTGHGLGSDWKVHTLRKGDEDKDTVIALYPTLVEFRSESGNSSTSWKPEYDISPI